MNAPDPQKPPIDWWRITPVLLIQAGLILTLAVFVIIGMQQIEPGEDNKAGPQLAFAPPLESDIPDGPQGEAILRGKAIFLDPARYAGAHVGSGLTCNNCHLDGGRLAGAAPMWAAWGMYPAWRKKNDRINTMEDRIMGCFVYSMNAQASPSGKPPPAGSDIYRDLETYFAWLATGAPIGQELPGRGYPELPEPDLTPDYLRGKTVFEAQCAVCHGVEGQGQARPGGGYTYPPLWGPHSFNWGAGMSKIANAAGFIKANMPFGSGNSLTNQQAWDVATFVVSHERPRDPRQTGSIEEARAKFHKSGDFYGQVIQGDVLGDGVE